MTVSYQYEVASSTSGGFTRLLFMWRGSLYKLIYRELLLFLVAFGLLSALYRNLFTVEQKRLFEKVVIYCDTFINLIPLSFVLGFYVAYVAGRWWQQYMAIPWPDKVMHSLALYIAGNDDHGRMLRRSLMRYLNLSLILVLRSISSAVKRRFPTMDHLVEAGFMTAVELQMFQSVPNVEFNTYWIPCTWFICLLKETKNGNRISDAQGLKVIVEEFNEFRSKCGLLWSYDWISIPLVYTQVVTLATYSFFLAALVGRQYVDEAKKPLQMEIDIYIPVFTILQFFFFMGLLKVAEQLINPFGDDDEDFELNWLIDRHTKVSYLGVDTLMARCPPLVKDKYFDDVDLILPYTGAAFAYKKKTYRGSVHNMQVPEDQQSMFLPEIAEEDEEDRESVRRCSAKTASSTNLNISSSWPSAGIWRPTVDTPFPENSPPVEDPLQNVDFFMGRPVGPKRKGVPWHAAVNPVNPAPLPPPPPPLPLSQQNSQFFYASAPPTLQHWSSNSTIESYCSTSGVLDLNPFDNSFEQQNRCNDIDINSATSIESAFDFTPASKLPRKKTESKTKRSSSYKDILGLKDNINKHLKEFSSAHEHPKLHRLLARRQSSSSGQWKGVRWKPVLDNSTGDVWSDNNSRRSSSDLCQNCKNKMNVPSTPENSTGVGVLCSNDSLDSSVQSIDDNKTVHSPLPPVSVVTPILKHLDKSDRSKSFFIIKDGDEYNDDHSESVISNSLPNIASYHLQNQIITNDDLRPSSSTKSDVEIQIKPLHNKISLSYGNLLGTEQNRICRDTDKSAQSTV